MALALRSPMDDQASLPKLNPNANAESERIMRDKLTSRMQRPKKGTLCQSIRQSAALLWKSTPHSIPHPKPSHSSSIGLSILPAPKRFLRESQEYRNPTGEANWLSKLTQELPPRSEC